MLTLDELNEMNIAMVSFATGALRSGASAMWDFMHEFKERDVEAQKDFLAEVADHPIGDFHGFMGFDTLRELEEELGQPARELECVARIPPSEATGWEFVRLYRARQEGPIRFPCAEIEAGLWLAPGEIEAWIERRPGDFATGFLECWKAWRALP